MKKKILLPLSFNRLADPGFNKLNKVDNKASLPNLAITERIGKDEFAQVLDLKGPKHRGCTTRRSSIPSNFN